MTLHAQLTEDEIIATLERSSFEITILVEGSDDIIIYRNLEGFLEKKGYSYIDVLGVGGRNTILNIFNKKKSGSILQDKKIIFIVDKDIWVNVGIPDQYINKNLIFTFGYSIENDVFMDVNCSAIVNSSPSQNEYEVYLDKFMQWYVLALQATINNIGNTTDLPDKRSIGRHPCEVMNRYEEFCQLDDGETYPIELLNVLKENIYCLLRGKSLLAIFTKICKNHTPKGLFEIAAANPKNHIQRIFNDVEKLLKQ